jgi:hypothetical protein
VPVAFSESVTSRASRLVALRFASFTVGSKDDEIDVTEARSCNQE